MNKIRQLLIIGLACIIAVSALAFNVNVIWDPAPEGTVSTYTVSIEKYTLKDDRIIYVALQPAITVPATYTNVVLTNLTTNVWYRITIVASNHIGKSPMVELYQLPIYFPQKTNTIFQIKTNI